jgi:hypothetical protein
MEGIVMGLSRKSFSRLAARAVALALLVTLVTVLQTELAVAPASATVTVTSHFIWTATSSNTIDGFITEINNDATNGNPDAILFVTPVFNSGGVCGCVDMTDPIAVFYVGGDQKWGIIDSIISPGNIPAGAEFNVLVVQKPSSSVFTARATASNVSGNGFTLNQKSTVGKGASLLQVTQNYTPNGKQVPDVNGYAPGVVYGLGPSGDQWDIQNLHNSPMPIGAAYNVMVGGATSNGGKAVLLTGNNANTSGATTYISNKETNGNPNAVVFATPNADPSLNFGAGNPHPTGVGYATSRSDIEYVFNEDGASMPALTYYFNLLVFPS